MSDTPKEELKHRAYPNNDLSKITIIVDESGTLPDPKDTVIVIAAVGVLRLESIESVTRKIKRLFRQSKQKQPNEIKFYRAGERTKYLYLKELLKHAISLFVLVVDKNGQKIPDTPHNMAALSFFLLEECVLFFDKKISRVVFDKHFHKKSDEEQFDKILAALLMRNIQFEHLDSIMNTEINAADMIAGSILSKYSGKNDRFYNIIKSRIVVEKFLNWKEVRRIFLDRIKKLT